MPTLTRWFLKSSLLYLLLAVMLGVLLEIPNTLDLDWAERAFSPFYFHSFMVGWVAQLIFGVVFWMFPKFSKEQPRGSETLGWATFWLLNSGLLIRLVAEPAQAIQNQVWWSWLLALSAVLQWLAGMAFVLNTWRRVKER
jgi:cbb3-type cytochrome oxidase subunit 1